jgi:EAL domain-containing protein (putative c-di-GMP-specific phosphodiesterase class I)
VKLNPGFLKRMKIDEEVHQWMKHCITQALGQDVQVMAQGLEAIDQYEAVKGLGCILGQGGFFHMPMNALSFERLLASYSMGQSHQRPVYLGGHGCKLSAG